MENTTVLSPAKLRTLYKLLREYMLEIKTEQPLAAQVISMICTWIEKEERFDI